MNSRMLLVLFLWAQWVTAQANNQVIPELRLDLVNGDCDANTRVALVGRDGMFGETRADEQCHVSFSHVPAGTYHVSVSRADISRTDSGTIELRPNSSTRFEINLKPAANPEFNFVAPSSGFVAASDLEVPGRARKEFDRANELLAKRDFKAAIQKLNKAIEIYPSYSVAYNNLGVIYARLGDRERERAALQNALRINDRFALAYTNLGRLKITEGNFAGARALLAKALAFDPKDLPNLILLAYSQMMDGLLQQAAVTAQSAHALEKPHAFAHRLAARALEQEQQYAAAAGELQIFLEEEATGPATDAARRELQIVQALSRKPALNMASERSPARSINVVP